MQTIPEKRGRGTLPNSFYETNTTSRPKPRKRNARNEKQTNILHNVNARTCNNILASQVRQGMKSV